MAGNVQIKRALLCFLASVFCLTGCGKETAVDNPYSFEEHLEAFESGKTGEVCPGFAADLCVASGIPKTDSTLSAEAAGVFDLNGGTALFEENVFARMNPASTTKIMTAILALKYGDLADIVTVTDDAVITEAGSSMAGVKPGDRISLEDLLYGLMIPSGNDAANAIAVHIGGSIEQFVEMMNEEAASIGATDTHFANANGLTDPNHYTTAYDLYLIFHDALKYDKFRTVIGTLAHTAVYSDEIGNPKSSTWGVSNYYMNGKAKTPDGLLVFGGKTGTTKAAGYCLIMGSRTDDGREYASVIMKAGTRDALYRDMTEIISKIDK